MFKKLGGFSDYTETLFNAPELSDVAIVLDNDEGENDTPGETKTFHGHRVILATMSDYFRSMLYGSFVEATKKEIRLPGVPYSIFMELMRYVYFGWTDPEWKALQEAVEYYALAQMLLINPRIGMFVESWMIGQTGRWNRDLLKIFALSFEWEMVSLQLRCNMKINKLAYEFLQNSSFVELPLGAVQMMLDTCNMNCTRVELEQAIQAWIGHHEGEISVDVAEELNRKVAKFGELCNGFDLLPLYTKERMQKSEEFLQIAECSEPEETILHTIHEYSYNSELLVINCIDLRGVQICLRANPQFGPQYRRIKSELELCLEVKCQDEKIQRNLSVPYDFTQQEQQPVTIFFPEMNCCKNDKLIFNFNWKGSGVQPLLQSYGFVKSMAFEGATSHVTHAICKMKFNDYDSDGHCPYCQTGDDLYDVNFGNSCGCGCCFTGEEEDEAEGSENGSVGDSL